jgi:hypothetical protein
MHTGDFSVSVSVIFLEKENVFRFRIVSFRNEILFIFASLNYLLCVIQTQLSTVVLIFLISFA